MKTIVWKPRSPCWTHTPICVVCMTRTMATRKFSISAMPPQPSLPSPQHPKPFPSEQANGTHDPDVIVGSLFSFSGSKPFSQFHDFLLDYAHGFQKGFIALSGRIFETPIFTMRTGKQGTLYIAAHGNDHIHIWNLS